MADFSKAQTQNDVDELKKIKKKLEASNDENDELKLIRAYNELQKMKAELKDAIYKLEETDTELDTLVRKTNREIEAFNTTVGSKEEEAAQCQAHLIAFATDLGLKPITSMQAKPDIERKDDH